MYRIRDVIDMAIRGIPEKYRAEMWMIYSGMCTYVQLHEYLLCTCSNRNYFPVQLARMTGCAVACMMPAVALSMQALH